MLQMKYVKVALNSCSIRERIDINMYYKCWGYDHHANECKEADKKKQCRKCGEKGHHSGESKNDAYCIKCNRVKHAAGSAQCMAFKDALRKGRRRRGKRAIGRPEGARMSETGEPRTRRGQATLQKTRRRRALRMPPRVSKGKGERGGTASQGGEPSISPTPDPMLKLEILQCNTNRSQASMGPLQGAVRPCRWWRGLSNRSDARGDAGGSFVLLAGSPMPARLERTGEKQRTAQPSGSTTKVVARELANPGSMNAFSQGWASPWE
jgi:hypothetical protein